MRPCALSGNFGADDRPLLPLPRLSEKFRFIRVGTLDDSDQFLPDVHIFTCSKQPWIILPKQDRRVEVFYEFKKIWTSESMERLAKIEDSTGIRIS